MSLGRRWGRWAAVPLVLVLGGCTSSVGQSAVADQGYVSGDGSVRFTPVEARDGPAVAFHGRTLDGGSFDVADHRGQVVVVNVWASWCPPCIKEAPALQQVWRGYRSRGVQVVGVDVGDNRAAARAHERRFHIGYPSIEDRSGRLLLAFRGTLNPSARPSTLVLDTRGRVAARVLGRVEAATLAALLDDVLAERRGSGT